MPVSGWKSVSIPEDMVKEIQRIIKENPHLGYKNVSQFVINAIRKLIEQYKPRFEHFNTYEDHVTIIDRTGKHARLIDIYFRNGKAYCEFCQDFDCEHIRFALKIPKVVEPLRRAGWVIDMDEGKVIRGPF